MAANHTVGNSTSGLRTILLQGFICKLSTVPHPLTTLLIWANTAGPYLVLFHEQSPSLRLHP